MSSSLSKNFTSKSLANKSFLLIISSCILLVILISRHLDDRSLFYISYSIFVFCTVICLFVAYNIPDDLYRLKILFLWWVLLTAIHFLSRYVLDESDEQQTNIFVTVSVVLFLILGMFTLHQFMTKLK